MVEHDDGATGRPASERPNPDGATVEAVLQRWETRCRQAEASQLHPWPEGSARSVIEGLLLGLTGDEGWALRQASAAFARATTSVPLLSLRLTCLRQVMTEETTLHSDLAARLSQMLDTVSSVGTRTALAELEDAALTDALTDAGNRRSFERAAGAALATCGRSGEPLTVVAIDLDGLKAVNDNEGHAAGDRALANLATAIRGGLRKSDQLFRIGGDEFVVLLPLATADAVPALLDRARQLGAPRFSWGAATAPADGARLEGLLKVADGRLYDSRRAAGYRRHARPEAMFRAGGFAGAGRHWARAALAAAISVAAVLGLVAIVSGAKSPGTTTGGVSVSTTSSLPGGGGPAGAQLGTGGAANSAPTGSGFGTPPPPGSGGQPPPSGTSSISGTGTAGGSSTGSGTSPSTTTTTAPLATVTIPTLPPPPGP